MPKNIGDRLAILYQKLLTQSTRSILPGGQIKEGELCDSDLRDLICAASALALEDDDADRTMAYEIATRTVAISSDKTLLKCADFLLSRLGNFPGRDLLRRRHGDNNIFISQPLYLYAEIMARESENSNDDIMGRRSLLTDFQAETIEILGSSDSVSISAPTSAGKSFVLSLDVIRTLRYDKQQTIVYLVPTRALIRQVLKGLRETLKSAGLGHVPLRSVPMPTGRSSEGSAVFVLTQERLFGLLNSDDLPEISCLIIDEAQGIGDGARGILLQSAIDTVLLRFPEARLIFACPMAKNPEYLLKTFRRHDGVVAANQQPPVTQNLILVEPAEGSEGLISFNLLTSGEVISLGARRLDFSLQEEGVLGRRSKLALAVSRQDGCCIIYANGSRDAEEIAEMVAKGLPSNAEIDGRLAEFIDYLVSHVHGQYGLIGVLRKGVGFHYGNMPGSVRSGVEELCQLGLLKFICCTSTLLQGINLPAKNIIIENPKKGNGNPMKRSDFVNLAGRAGRLMKEFHGNVWCINPSSWQNDSYRGPDLHEMESAFSKCMREGGNSIERVMNDDPSLDDGNRDIATAALIRLYADVVIGGNKKLVDEPFVGPGAQNLPKILSRLEALATTLPDSVFIRNRGVLPMRLEALATWMRGFSDLKNITPIPPFIPGTNSRTRLIFEAVERKLHNDTTNRYQYFARLASDWMHQKHLHEIIRDEIAFTRMNENEKDKKESDRSIIYNLIDEIEHVIRYRFVKHLRAYNDVLISMRIERGEENGLQALPPMHLFLECGAANPIALNLISMGLSRTSALIITRKIWKRIPEGNLPESCLEALRKENIEALGLPSYCLREVKRLLLDVG